MKKFLTQSAAFIFAIALVIAALYGIYWVLTQFGGFIKSLDVSLGGEVLAVSGAIIAASITVVLGQYLKGRSEIRANLRERKIDIYDQFLTQLFKQFHERGDSISEDGDELVNFLRDWQSNILLRGDNKVLLAYVSWKEKLNLLNAQSVFATDELIRAIRQDIGLSNSSLTKGFFTHFWLRHSDIFLAAAKQNPNLTFDELAALESRAADDTDDPPAA